MAKVEQLLSIKVFLRNTAFLVRKCKVLLAWMGIVVNYEEIS